MLARIDISNENLHQVVLNVLTSKKVEFNPIHLKEMSKWVDRFIRSGEQRMTLNLPFYDQKDQLSVTYYVYYYSLAYEICHSEPVEEFKGTALFDIFGFNRYYEPSSSSYVLPFLKENQNVLYFGSDTVVQKNSFIPLFNEDDLRTLTPSDESIIADLFILFSEIAKKQIVSKPIEIKIRDSRLVVVSKAKLLSTTRFITCIPSEQYSLDDLDELLTHLESKSIGSSFFVGFPSKRSINPVLYNEFIPKTKACEIYFNRRLCYSEIEQCDIVVLPIRDEEDMTSFLKGALDSILIYSTEHSKELIKEIQNLKSKWSERKFNPYKTPFPSRWMLFIHQELSLQEWIVLYKNQFPEVDGETLQSVIAIIKLVYEINWIDKFFSDKKGTSVLITDSRIFSDTVAGFYRYIEKKFNIVPVDSKDLNDQSEVMLVDSFNLVNLCNVATQSKKIKFIIPDFLYFNHFPELKTYFVKYFSDALLGGLRSKLDPVFSRNENKMLDILDTETGNTEREKRAYYDRFKLEDDEFKLDSTNEIALDIELGYDELANSVRLRESKAKAVGKHLIVTTDDDQRLELRFNSEILIKEKGVVIGARALSLTEGLEFLPKSEVVKSIDKNSLASKLSSISEKAKNWKSAMYSKYKGSADLYDHLKLMGLSVQEGTFLNDYTSITDKELGLPRSKRDWQIVCEVLQIEDYKESWRNHKCKGDYNRLKKAYLEIISILTNSEINGVDVDAEVLEQIRRAFLRCTGIPEEEFDGLEEAQEIVENITKQIKLLKVKQIEPQLG